MSINACQSISDLTPKVGHILLFFPRIGWIRGQWCADRGAIKPRPYWTHDAERIFGVREVRADQPTHWMPLPPLPKIDKPDPVAALAEIGKLIGREGQDALAQSEHLKNLAP